jgi:hypothetical protein
MGSVFGNAPNPHIYRGVGAMNYYTPAYISLVLASIGNISDTQLPIWRWNQNATHTYS